MNRIAIYARKSTESEDRQVMSIESQVKELKQFANKMNWQIAEVFIESKSAKAPGRETFNRLYSRVDKGQITELLCWKLDRLARNPVDGGALIWAMEENKLRQIHTPQRSFLNTGNDKFWLQLEFGMAKKYVDDLSDNVKRGLKARAEKGWYPFQAPLGYLNDTANKTIVPDPERFALVRKMWDMLLTGNYTPNRIVSIANNEWGLRTKPFRTGGNCPVASSYVYQIFTNPFYHGFFKYNGVVYPAKHPAMVTESEFALAQRILKTDFSTRPKKYEFAYSGLIKCGECGASVTAEHKTNRYGYKYIYYHCTRNKRYIECQQKCIEERELERQLLRFLDTISIDTDVLKLVLDILEKQKGAFKSQQETIVDNLKKRLSVCERSLSELVNIKLRGLLNDDDFAKKRIELKAEKTGLQSQLKHATTNAGEYVKQSVGLFEYAAKVKSVFANGSTLDKKSIIRYVGSNLTIMNKKLSISAVEPFRFIQDCNSASSQNNARIEPPKHGLAKHKSPHKNASLCANLALVENVRTFFSKAEGYAQNNGDSTKV